MISNIGTLSYRVLLFSLAFFINFIFVLYQIRHNLEGLRAILLCGVFFLCSFFGGFCKIAMGNGIIVGMYSLGLLE